MIRFEELPTTVRLTLTSPVLEMAVLDELGERLAQLASESPGKPLLLTSAHPTIFLAGAHLGEIARLCARSSVPYARRGRDVVSRLRSHPAPTVAAVHGSCSGGGFDLVTACDLVVAGPEASFGHPGVRRGLVTGWGGSVELRSVIGTGPTARALLQGAMWSAAELASLGAVVKADDDVLGAAARMAESLGALDSIRLAAWRSLRSGRGLRRCGILSSPAIIDGAAPSGR